MDGKAIKILLVEDNPGDARLIREMLAEAWGRDFVLEWVPRLAEGLERLNRGEIDLVLLDLGLPDSSGLDTFVKAHAQAPQVAFVVLTGLVDETLAFTAIRKGAQDYLFKREIDPQLLRRTIRYATERKQAELALGAERKKLFAVLNSLPAFVHLKGADFKIRFANRRFQKIFGNPGNKPCYELLRGRSEPCEDCHSLEVLKTKVPQQFEWTNADNTRTYNTRTYEVHHYPFCSGDDLQVLTLGIDISERKEAEEELHWELAIKTALADISNALISRTSSAAIIANIVLVHAKNLTKSEHGFVTLIDPSTGDSIVYTPTRMMGQCQISGEDKKIVFSKGPDGLYPGLWGHALNTREAFYTNSPAGHPAYQGISEGHIPLKNFLSVPAAIGVGVVGQIALANSPRDYTDRDLQALQRLAKFYALALQRQQAEENLRESERNLRYLASQLLTAQERERERISRDLHDDLGQSLMVLKLQLKAVERKLPSDLSEVRNELDAGVNTIDDIVDNVRRLAKDLRPSFLEDLGLSVALKHLLDNFRRNNGIKVSFEMEDIEDLFSPEGQLMIYRIFQEALTNIAKYAQATQVSINIKCRKKDTVFTIKDNGKGFDLKRVLAGDSSQRGLGLSAMEERVNMLGGSLEIWSQEGQGTRISLIVPFSR